jgi:hypothetical protein
MNTWLLRVLWVSLPVTAGDALADSMHPWSDATRLVATALLWILWAVVLSALLVPRPLASTLTRLGTPIALAAIVLAAASSEASTASWTLALVVTVVACALAVRGHFVLACAQGAAYGDEERFPLKVPPGIAFVVLPIAITVVGAGVAAGPMLLAAEEWVLGAIAVAVGWPAAFVVGRLVHQLSRRWVVLVPAGIVIADPLTLTDPVLFVRERVAGIGPGDPGRRPPADALDLRLGAAFGSCALLLTDEADLMRRSRGKGVRVQAALILVAATAAGQLLERAGARRLPVRRD